MMTFYPLIYLLFLVIGPMISVTSNSWFSAWLGLEMNLLAFIPLIMSNHPNNQIVTETAIKYFVVQALASSMILFISTAFFLNAMVLDPSTPSSLLNFALLLKMGAAPLHFWFPMVMSGLNWINAFIVCTWQKIGPLTLMLYVNMENIVYFFAILSVIIGSMTPLIETSLRKIFAYSSIFNLGWILTLQFYKENLWIVYFIIYSYMNFIIFFMLQCLSVNHMISLFEISDDFVKTVLVLNILSFSGLPPFLGFINKLMALMTLLSQTTTLIVLMICSAYAIYFYTRLGLSILSTNLFNRSWTCVSDKNKITFTVLTFLPVLGLATVI